MARFRLALFLLLAMMPAANAQQPVRPAEDSLDSTHLQENNQLGTRFRNAEARAAQGLWSEAIEEYQRILVEAGDELAPVDKRHVVQARWLAQARLSALPPEALRLYRSRIDPPAKKLLEQGRASRDPATLQRIVDETFCSSYTDQAIDLLGELAFERGDFEEAEQLWRMIVPPASLEARPDDGKLAVTDSKIDTAGIRAKQILAQLFRGDVNHLGGMLDAFGKAHPTAKGRLAGSQGVYVDLLKALTNRAADLGSPTGPNAWNQFAGDAEHNHVLAKAEGRLARLPCPEGPAWQRPLDPTPPRPGQKPGPQYPEKIVSVTESGRLLGYYPVISGDRVVVANSQIVKAYLLSTGQEIFNYKGELSRENLIGKPGVEPDVAFPLTVVGDRIYARLGSKLAGPPRRPRGFGGWRRGNFDPPQIQSPPQSVLVCLTMQPNLGQEVWTKLPPAGDQGEVVVFEGAPIVHHGRVYIAITRFPAGQTQTFVACYDAESGEMRWQRKVCETAELKDGESRSRHHLLTLAGPNIVYCSHSGAIIALDAASGHPRWGVRYASRGPKTSDGQPSFRSLAPCCYAAGRIYAAPLDFDRILCLDSRTGQTLWESDPMEVVHILGVSRGKIFCTTLTPRHGIRALNASTGSSIGGWMQPGDDSDLSTYGRGLLAGDWVYWPNAKGLQVLRQSDGEPVMFDKDIHGNLAAADGCLIAADSKNLSAYLPEKWALLRRSQEANQDGASALTVSRLALAEYDAGFTDRALSTLERALAMASAADQRERLRGKLHELLLESARSAARNGSWTKVDSFLKRAADKPFTASEQVRAVALEARLAEEAGKPDRAVAAWQVILENPSFRQALLLDPENIGEPAGLVASDQLNRLIQQHGRNVYAAVEARAEEFARRNGASPATSEQLVREFPQAAVSMQALESRAQQAESANHAWEAAALYRTLLELPDSSSNRVSFLAGLARAYQRESCWNAARTSLEQLEREGGPRIEALVHPTLSVGEWAREQRRVLPCCSNIQAMQSPFFTRRWHARGDFDGVTTLSEAGDCLFRVVGSQVDCLAVGTGKQIWSRALPWPVSWLGRHSDLLIAAGERGILCIRQGDGATSWKREFAESARSRLHGFQIAAGRLYFFLGASRYVAWDVTSGRCLWSAWAPASRLGLEAPAGCFGPDALVAGTSCILSTGFARPLIFDSRSGARLDPGPVAQFEAIPSLSVAEGRFGLLAGRQAIQAIEMTSGRPSWQFRFDAPQALAGEQPQLLERDNHLFVQIAYNYGYLLEHLDSKTGVRQWSVPAFVGPRPLDLASGDIDEMAVYCSGAGGLEARRLADGQLVWKRQAGIDSSRRKMQRIGSVLLNQPARSVIQGWEFAWHGLSVRWPSFSPVATEPFCTAEILDPKTGLCLQALNVAKPAPETVPFAAGFTSFSAKPVVRLLATAVPAVLVTPEKLLVVQGRATTAFDVTTAAGSPSGSANISR